MHLTKNDLQIILTHRRQIRQVVEAKKFLSKEKELRIARELIAVKKAEAEKNLSELLRNRSARIIQRMWRKHVITQNKAAEILAPKMFTQVESQKTIELELIESETEEERRERKKKKFRLDLCENQTFVGECHHVYLESRICLDDFPFRSFFNDSLTSKMLLRRICLSPGVYMWLGVQIPSVVFFFGLQSSNLMLRAPSRQIIFRVFC